MSRRNGPSYYRVQYVFTLPCDMGPVRSGPNAARPQSKWPSSVSSKHAKSTLLVRPPYQFEVVQPGPSTDRTAESFAPRRKYGLMVWQTRHPGVSQYFAEALNAIRSQLLLRDTMEGEVGVRLHHRTTDQEFERYTFHTLPFLSKYVP